MANELEIVSYDTNVVREAIGLTRLGGRYQELIGSRAAALTYFVQGELRAGKRGRMRERRLAAFLEGAQILPAPDEAMLRHYVDSNRLGRRLGLQHGVGEDLWMIAQTAQHDFSFVTHDRNAARVAKAMGLVVYTLLPDIEADYERDRATLAETEIRGR